MISLGPVTFPRGAADTLGWAHELTAVPADGLLGTDNYLWPSITCSQ
jgi:hypothetical protein